MAIFVMSVFEKSGKIASISTIMSAENRYPLQISEHVSLSSPVFSFKEVVLNLRMKSTKNRDKIEM